MRPMQFVIVDVFIALRVHAMVAIFFCGSSSLDDHLVNSLLRHVFSLHSVGKEKTSVILSDAQHDKAKFG